jgi:hypothetical protein
LLAPELGAGTLANPHADPVLPGGIAEILKLPADRRFNPLALNPYVLYKALPQVKQYSQSELVRAMDLLLQCNQRLVLSGLGEALVLQQTLVQIVAGAGNGQPRQPSRAVPVR